VNLGAAAVMTLWLGLTALPTTAADDPAPPPPTTSRYGASTDGLGEARSHIQAGRWPQALRELRRVNLRADADWNNLMGFVLRKGNPPDYAGAQQHYDAALRINPAHQGALEYAGELALMQNDVPRAQEYLRRLQATCSSPCEPLDDLQAAIRRHTAPR
jgi:Flp pilus assembly protein TadD